MKICRAAGGWQERPLLWCLHAVSLARDKNPFVLFGVIVGGKRRRGKDVGHRGM